MPRARRPEEELDPGVAREAEARPAVAPSAEQVLALQRSAGNAAVGNVLHRFYVDSGAGVEWKPGDPGSDYVDTGRMHRWFLWNYPIYAPKPEAEAPAGRRNRRGGRKRKGKGAVAPAAVQDAAPADETELAEDEGEQAEATAAPEPEPEPQPAETAPAPDLDGFVQKRSRGQRQHDARAAMSDEEMAELARQVDGHGGDAQAIAEAFNRLFNVLDAKRLLTPGALQDAYISQWDVGRGFSVEITIPRLGNWVAHAHLDAHGRAIDDENATHYKRAAERFDLGRSVALSPRQVAKLLPAPGDCLDYAVRRTRNRQPHRRVQRPPGA